MFKIKQHVISISHKTKRAVRISLMLPLMCSYHDYLKNHHKHRKDDDDDDKLTIIQIFKLKEKYVQLNANMLVGRQQFQYRYTKCAKNKCANLCTLV